MANQVRSVRTLSEVDRQREIAALAQRSDSFLGLGDDPPSPSTVPETSKSFEGSKDSNDPSQNNDLENLQQFYQNNNIDLNQNQTRNEHENNDEYETNEKSQVAENHYRTSSDANENDDDLKPIHLILKNNSNLAEAINLQGNNKNNNNNAQYSSNDNENEDNNDNNNPFDVPVRVNITSPNKKNKNNNSNNGNNNHNNEGDKNKKNKLEAQNSSMVGISHNNEILFDEERTIRSFGNSGAKDKKNRKNHSQFPSQSLPANLSHLISFNKEDVPKSQMKSSAITYQLQSAHRQTTGTMEYDNDGIRVSITNKLDRYANHNKFEPDPFKVARTANIKCTVYLLDGQIVQLEVKPQCTAIMLIGQVLKQYELEHVEESPADFSSDPYSYRLYVAEEDGEIDDDCPPLDDNCKISSTGSENFSLKKKNNLSNKIIPLNIQDNYDNKNNEQSPRDRDVDEPKTATTCCCCFGWPFGKSRSSES